MKYIMSVISLIIEIGFYIPLFIGETIVANMLKRDVMLNPCRVSYVIGSLFSLIAIPIAIVISPFIGIIVTI